MRYKLESSESLKSKLFVLLEGAISCLQVSSRIIMDIKLRQDDVNQFFLDIFEQKTKKKGKGSSLKGRRM